MKHSSGGLARVLLCGRIPFIAAVVATVLIVASAQANERVFELGIVGGVLSPALDAVRVAKGDTVVLIWNSDTTVEIHLHGYDLIVEVTPGRPEQRRFEAFATGRFPLTIHGTDEGHAHVPLTYLEVLPD